MKFKAGDQVKYIGNSHQFLATGDIGEVTGGVVCNINSRTAYDVYFVGDGICTINQNELSFVGTTEETLSLISDGSFWSVDRSRDLPQMASLKRECDCGGFKTYGSMEPENHSSWCSSRQRPNFKLNTFTEIKSAIIKGFKA